MERSDAHVLAKLTPTWRKPQALFLALALVVMSASACSALPVGDVKPPSVEAAEKVTASSNELTFELLRGLSESADGGNVVISPLSLSSLLAMLLAGSSGDTAEAISAVMHLDGSSPDDAASFGQLLRYLAQATPDVDLTVANALWADPGYTLNDDFVTNLKENFDASADEVDLGSQEAADTIDKWVSEKTRGLIEKLSDALQLPDPRAVTVLLNAVYFKGEWTSPFDRDRTGPSDFERLDGSKVKVPMMSQSHEYQVAQGDGFTTVRLPYGKSERFVMDIFVPDATDDLEQFVAHFDEDTWKAAGASLHEQHLFLSMPRFELTYKVSTQLDSLLKKLGMQIAYSPQADFSPMSPSNSRLTGVAHKTYIRVDEEGTEAAAVSGAMVTGAARPNELRIDHPFVFTISDTETGTILFAGVVTDPSAK